MFHDNYTFLIYQKWNNSASHNPHDFKIESMNCSTVFYKITYLERGDDWFDEFRSAMSAILSKIIYTVPRMSHGCLIKCT